jgi:TolA-binding protein
MTGLLLNRKAHVTAVVLVLATAVSGCWTSAAAGDKLREEAVALNRRIIRLEDESRANRSELSAKLAQLEEVLQKATEVLTRTSADRGAQVDQMQERLAALEGQLAELQHSFDTVSQQTSTRTAELSGRLDQLARKVGIDTPLPATEIPADKSTHYNAATTAYAAGEYSKARSLFREYITRYPNDDRIDNALYGVGATYLAEGKPATALGEFRKVIADYGKGDAVDLALFNMAEAFYQLHACTDAKSALEALLRRKLSKEMQRSAKERLNAIKKSPANYCTS